MCYCIALVEKNKEIIFTCLKLHSSFLVDLVGENSTMEEIVAAVDALLGPIVTSMCTADCSGHGVCSNATCFCNEGGWQGERNNVGDVM